MVSKSGEAKKVPAASPPKETKTVIIQQHSGSLLQNVGYLSVIFVAFACFALQVYRLSRDSGDRSSKSSQPVQAEVEEEIVSNVFQSREAEEVAKQFSEPYKCGTDIGCPKEWRRVLPYNPGKKIAGPMPRVHISEFDNSIYSDLDQPFVLTGAMEGWRIGEALIKGGGKLKPVPNLKEMKQLVADYYPFNMNNAGGHPYLTRLHTAWKDLTSKGVSRFGRQPKDMGPEGRYVHAQLTPDLWDMFENKSYVDVDRQPWLESGGWWMDKCLAPHLKEEFFLKNHWVVWLAGAPGAGMFEHIDALQASSWHAHAEGRKWWHVCKPGGSICWEALARPGEIVYYPESYKHKTQCVDTAVTLTGTVATQTNHRRLAAVLFDECVKGRLGFRFSGELCDNLEKCYEVMRAKWSPDRPLPREKTNWRNWATTEIRKERSEILSHHNNYDGRNFITE